MSLQASTAIIKPWRHQAKTVWAAPISRFYVPRSRWICVEG